MDELGAALKSFDANPGIGAIVITGGDKAFAAGADITPWPTGRTWMSIRRLHHSQLGDHPHHPQTRHRRRGGLRHGRRMRAVALACDIVVAAVGAFALPRSSWPCCRAPATQRLPRAVGKAKAMDILPVRPHAGRAEADRYGLVSRVVPDAELLARTLALAGQIASYSLPALMAIRSR